MTVRGEPGIDPCGQDAVILAVGAAMAQATFSVVFDQIHLVSRPTKQVQNSGRFVKRPYGMNPGIPP